jgi:hypothetical protein
LLVLEEEKLGHYSSEHLTKLDGYITRIEELIGKQRDRVDKLIGNEPSATLAEGLLSRLLQTQALFQQHRMRVVDLLRD